MIIVEPKDDFVEFVHFGIPFDCSTSVYMLMQNINLLHWFISYFKDQACRLIEQAKKQRFQLPDLPKYINSKIASIENNLDLTTITDRLVNTFIDIDLISWSDGNHIPQSLKCF